MHITQRIADHKLNSLKLFSFHSSQKDESWNDLFTP